MIPMKMPGRPAPALLGAVGLLTGLFWHGVRADDSPKEPDAQSDAKVARPIPFPDGVTGPARRLVFVSSPKGGIQGIRLEDGKILWTNDEVTARPWLVAGPRLVALGERVAVLDGQNGKLLRKCDAPAYPAVKVPERCTVSFNLWDAHVTGNVLEAKWYAVALIDRSKGRPFPFQTWTAFNKAAPAGTLKCQLDTGRVDVQADKKPVDVTGELIPATAKPAQRRPAGLPVQLTAAWQRIHMDEEGRITALDGRLVGVSMKLEKAGAEYLKQVVLESWDLKTGAAAPPVELVKDKALAIANIRLTADRRHAVVQFSTSEVTVYSLADGKAVGQRVKGVSSLEDAFVDGTRLCSAEPTGPVGGRVLRAIDLKNGQAAWERPIQARKIVPLPP
jgi:hypothetical protein